jgi:hypothetical protein
MKTTAFGAILGTSALICVLALVPQGGAAGVVLTSETMDRMLGGEPTCLNEGSLTRNCLNCPAAQECVVVKDSTDCKKVVLSSYEICGGTGSLPNHNCVATSTTEQCGKISYGSVDPKTKKCALNACTSTPDPCGNPKITVVVKACEF